MSARKRARTDDSTVAVPIGRFLVSRSDPAAKVSKTESTPVRQRAPEAEDLGDGSPGSPLRSPPRSCPNANGCVHCPSDHCKCLSVAKLLGEVYASLKAQRVTEVAGARQLCAKSLLPQFVARIIKLMKITANVKFVDFGCGNGSILFQVACQTGANCVGIEISEHNAQVAREAWPVFRHKYEKEYGATTGEVTIITGDGAKIIAEDNFFNTEEGGTAILLSNLLFPKPLTHYISERLRMTPVGTRVLCFDDLYPHGRSLAAIRDPEAFRLFEMKDYVWPEMSVEWCSAEGSFYIHWRK